MEAIFSKTVEIGFCDCDCQKRAKVSTINKLMAEIAGNAYTAAGMSHQWLWNHGYAFLLSKASIRLDRMPTADEIVTVSTWERGTKGAVFLREFEISDGQNQTIIDACTEWILIHPEKRQIIRPTAFEGFRAPLPEKETLAPKCRKLKLLDGEMVDQRQIRYSDLDGNGHVYNANYADIAVDVLPPPLRDQSLCGYQINFIHEATLGEKLQLYRKISGKTATVKGCIGEKDSFICEFQYS